MLYINFSRTGVCLPDFKVEDEAKSYLDLLSDEPNTEIHLNYSNILSINIFRAFLLNEYKHLQPYVLFYSEGIEVDMNSYMRSTHLWDNPDSTISKNALSRLIEPFYQPLNSKH